MPLDILPHLAQVLPLVIPGTLVVHITKRPLNGMGPRTVRRQPEQRQTGVTGHTLFDAFRFMNTLIIRTTIDTGHLSRRLSGVEQRQELPKQSIVFPRAETI